MNNYIVDYEWGLEYLDKDGNLFKCTYEDEGDLKNLRSVSVSPDSQERPFNGVSLQLCLIKHTRHQTEGFWEDEDENYVRFGRLSENNFRVPKRLRREFEENQYWIRSIIDDRLDSLKQLDHIQNPEQYKQGV